MLHYLYLLNAFPVLLLQVRDGGGVDVDVKVEGAKLPAVEALLITQDAFFGFATRWTQVCACVFMHYFNQNVCFKSWT